MLTQNQSELAERLFAHGAIKFGAFKLKLHETQPNAPLSPIYLNLRTPDNKDGKLDELMLRMIGYELRLLREKADSRGRYICGLPKAGEPLVQAMKADKPDSSLEIIAMQKVENADGTRRISAVLGEHEPDTLDLVDDLVTGADTKLEAIAAAQAANLEVANIYLLVDRMQGGAAQLRKAGYNVTAVFTLWDLLAHYLETGQIDSDKMAEVIDYITDNQVG